MFSFLFLIAILAFLTQAEDTCTPKYYTVNTFRTDTSFSFSCYGIAADCDIYYTPPGNGCNNNSLVSIGTVPENQTTVLTPGIDLELGGGFCSDNQIAVASILNNFHIVAALPRATEAGTYFNMALETHSDVANYQCSLAALSFNTSVSLLKDGIEQTLNIASYSLYQFTFDVNTSSRNLMKVVSDNPVIVSCLGDGTPNRLVTLQPISSEPLLVTTWGNSIVSVVLSDCWTNEWVTDFTKVKLDAIQEFGQPCGPVQVISHDDSRMYVLKVGCAFLITPFNDVCVSVTTQSNNFYMTAVGIPKAKLSTRFLHYDMQHWYYLFSFSETPCTSYTSPTSAGTIFNKEWIEGTLIGVLAFKFVPNRLNEFSWTECVEPTFFVLPQLDTRIPYLVGVQSDELWQPYFDSECRKALSEVPGEKLPDEEPPGEESPGEESPGEETPSEEPPVIFPTQSPETQSSDAPSIMTFCINWIPLLALFGLNLFSSILV